MTQRGNRRVRSAGRQISTAGDAELAAVADPLAHVQKTERGKGGPPDFSVEQFRRVARFVVSANLETASQLGALRRRLSDLLIDAGLIDDGTVCGKKYRELAANEFIDHAEIARRFRKIATSRNPLKPALYIDDMMAELHFALRQPPKRGDPIQVASARLQTHKA